MDKGYIRILLVLYIPLGILLTASMIPVAIIAVIGDLIINGPNSDPDYIAEKVTCGPLFLGIME